MDQYIRGVLGIVLMLSCLVYLGPAGRRAFLHDLCFFAILGSLLGSGVILLVFLWQALD